MWKIKLPPRRRAVNELIKALTYKDGKPKYPITNAQITEIRSAYLEYEKAKGIANISLECKSIDSTLLDAIKKGYDEVQIGGRLYSLRNRILANAGLCPCCGILVADELDHHLPKSTYKAFAIYSSNLVPICHKCNNKKRALTGLDPKERFIHVYYADIPENVQFLFATINLTSKSLNIIFEIKKIPQLNVDHFEMMRFQIERVNLNDRLSKELNILLSPLAFGIKDAYTKGGKVAVKYLLDGTAADMQRSQGINHWRPVAIKALADHDAFCDGGFFKPLALRNL